MKKIIKRIKKNNIDYISKRLFFKEIENNFNLPFIILYKDNKNYFFIYGQEVDNDNKIEALILTDCNIKECILYILSFLKNPSVVEMCLIVKTLKEYGIENNEIIKIFKNYLNQSISLKIIEDLIKISKYSKKLLILIHKKKIPLKDSLIFNYFENEEQNFLTDFFIKIKASTSDIRIISEMILDIKQKNNILIQELINKIDSDNLKLIYEKLINLRYPEYSKIKDEFNRLIKKISLPEWASIEKTPYFEDSNIILTFNFKSIDKLLILIDKLNKAINNGIFKKIFDLLNNK